MIAAHEIKMNSLYEVTNDDDAPNPDVGALVYPVNVVQDHGFYCYMFVWLTGYYEGQLVTGGRVSFNTMMPLKLVV